MTKVSFWKSAFFATRGLFNAVSSERNIKIQLFIGAITIFAAVLLNVSRIYLITMIMLISLVVILEMFNRSFEKLIDLISPEYNKEAGKIKDAMAGVVLVTFALAITVSLLILYQPLITFFKIVSENAFSLSMVIADILLIAIILLSYYIKRVNHKKKIANQKPSLHQQHSLYSPPQ